jgi:curved DNA-binding protein CbpA
MRRLSVTKDPFATLGIDEDADDEAVRQSYLALVRRFSPDREPERFQEIRAAYEAISNERARLEVKLLRAGTAALTRLKLHCLEAIGSDRHPARAATVVGVILDGLHSAEV